MPSKKRSAAKTAQEKSGVRQDTTTEREQLEPYRWLRRAYLLFTVMDQHYSEGKEELSQADLAARLKMPDEIAATCIAKLHDAKCIERASISRDVTKWRYVRGCTPPAEARADFAP
jgi:hypothetical protein